jgi:hypothetical protein
MPRMTKLANVSLEALEKEIGRRSKLLPSLIAKRDELNRQIAELETLGSRGRKARPGRASAKRVVRRRRRAKNKLSLADALAAVLKGKKAMGVAEATEAVLASGYKTTSAAFKSIVNQTLIKDKRFGSVSRGQYALK